MVDEEAEAIYDVNNYDTAQYIRCALLARLIDNRFCHYK